MGRPDLDFSGQMTCMTVAGNRAVVGGIITHDKLGPFHPLSPLEVPAPPGADCPQFTDQTGEFQTGNLVVHDVTP